MPNNTYQSEFTGPQMDSRLGAVATLQEAVAALETAVAAKYAKPAGGIPSSDMDADVQNALAKALTAVQSLADYYTKSETDALLAAIAASVNATAGVTAASLPTASASTVGKMYYIGPDGNGEYSRYVTSYDGTNYSWLPVGTTDIDLTQYATAAELSQLDQEIGEKEQIGSTPVYFSVDSWTTAKYISSDNGNEGNVSDDVAATSPVNVLNAAGKTLHYFRMTLTGSSGSIGMAFYDSNGNYISGEPALYGQSAIGMVDAEILVPANAATARFSCLTARETDFYAYMEVPKYKYLSGLGKDVQELVPICDELQDSVNELQVDLNGIPGGALSFNENTGGYYDTSGQYVQHSGLFAEIDLSDYAGQKLSLSISNASDSSTRATCLMVNGAVVDYVTENATSFDRTWDIPEGAILRESHSTTSVLSLAVSGKAPSVRGDNYVFPDGFSWQDNPLTGHIFKRENGKIDTDFDVATLKNTGGTTYYVSPSGNDNNDGLTPLTPLTKISTAIAKDDVGTIVLAGGFYNANRLPGSFTKGVNIIAAQGEKPVIIATPSNTWTKVDGYNNVYKSTATNAWGVVNVVDLTPDGDYTPYSKAGSIADVESTAKTYFTDGTGTYIHAESAPSANSIYSLQNSNPILATYGGDEVLYLEGIEVVGGNTYSIRVTNSGAGRPKFVAKNCKFGYSYGNALNILGADSICDSCVASYARNDGFNYHINNANLPRSIEVGCVGRYNGYLGFYSGGDLNTDNGSSSHDGGSAIRVNCAYHNNGGPNVADQGTSQQSLNLGCAAHHSTADSAQACGFQMNGTGAKMFCDTCAAYSNDFGFRAESGAVVKMRNCAGIPSVAEGGALGAY